MQQELRLALTREAGDLKAWIWTSTLLKAPSGRPADAVWTKRNHIGRVWIGEEEHVFYHEPSGINNNLEHNMAQMCCCITARR